MASMACNELNLESIIQRYAAVITAGDSSIFVILNISFDN